MNSEKPPTPKRPSSIGWTCSGLLTPRDAANLRRFNFWMISWALSFAASILSISADLARGAIGYLLTALTFALGVVAVHAYIRFLRTADELLKKIQLEAFAIGFGGGVIFMLTWALLRKLGAPEMSVAMFAAAMLIFWAVGQRIGVSKYMEDSN